MKTPAPARVSKSVPPVEEPDVEAPEVEERATPGRRRAAARAAKGGGSRWLLVAILLLLVGGGGVALALRGGGTGGDSDGTGSGNGGVSVEDPNGVASDDSPAVAIAPVTKEAFPSPVSVACSPDAKTLYFSAHTSLELLIADAATGKVTKSIALKERPGDLLMAPDGARLYAAIAAPAGQILAIDTVKQEIVATVPVGYEPTGLALSRDGKRLYACNRFDNTISVIDVATFKETGRTAVPREPVSAVVTADDKWLLVAHHLPLGAATGDYVGAAVSTVDLTTGKLASTISLPNGTTGVRGICLSPDGAFAYVTHILAHYQLPTTQLERGWMNTNALSIIKVADRTLLNTVLLDDVDLGAANPWAVACTGDGKYICVTHAGTHELSVIDRKALHERLDQVASGKKVATSSSSADVPLDLAFLVNVRRRVQLGSLGPRAMSIQGQQVFIPGYFSDSYSVVDLSKDVPSVQNYPLVETKPLSQVRRGELLFNDATACFQKWQSCASCHPDTRSDGLNWDLLNDGIGNPKNSRSMVLAHKTPPVMSLAARDKAETAVRAGFKHIQFALRTDEDLNDVDEYLKSVLPMPSPFLVNGRMNESAVRGKKVFEKAECISCHNPPYYTTLGAYNLGYGTGQDAEKPFDTPTLIECWRTGPYLYDGRAATLEEAFSHWNADDKHGKTSKLTPDEVKDLLEYIRSL
jgi:YVTN family beta-propeller protein